MGLFSSAKPAEAPPPAPETSAWTVPEGAIELKIEYDRLTEIMNGPDREAATIAKTRRDYCENALALKSKVFNANKAELPPCGIKEYVKLLERVRAIGMEDIWLRNFVEQWQMTPENFSAPCYGHINKTLCELEEATKRVNAEKKKEQRERAKKEVLPWEWPGPHAPLGMKAVPKKNGTWTHVTTTEEPYTSEDMNDEDREEARLFIEAFAKRCGLTEEEIADTVIWTGARYGTAGTRTKMALWQSRIALIAGNKHKQKSKEEGQLTETTTKTEPPKGGLFSKAAALKPSSATASEKENTSTPATAGNPAGQPNPAATATPGRAAAGTEKELRYSPEEFAKICAALGIKPDFQIETKEQADWVMSILQTIALQLEYIITQYQDVKPGLEKQFEGVKERFEDRLEKWADKNLDNGKKSVQLLWGSLGYANKAESVALDPNDKDERVFHEWIHKQSDEWKKQMGCKQIPYYERNLELIKAWALDRKKKGADMPPGLIYKAAKEDEFYIRPSLDTIKKNLKERKR